MTEVFALAALGWHPNIIRYFSSWVQYHHLYIQSEYCDGTEFSAVCFGQLNYKVLAGTLDKRLQLHRNLRAPIDEDEVRRITRQCASGLDFLHQQQLVHLDVKPG